MSSFLEVKKKYIYIYSIDIGQALEILKKKKQFYFANLEGFIHKP